jgi:hypothetical protein
MRTFFRDSTIDWECSQQRQQNEDYCRHWRQDARGEKGNAWLVAERREIINARQAHYFVPGVMAVMLLLALEGPFYLFDRAFEQPALESTFRLLWSRSLRRLGGRNHSITPCEPETILLLGIFERHSTST